MSGDYTKLEDWLFDPAKHERREVLWSYFESGDLKDYLPDNSGDYLVTLVKGGGNYACLDVNDPWHPKMKEVMSRLKMELRVPDKGLPILIDHNVDNGDVVFTNHWKISSWMVVVHRHEQPDEGNACRK